MIVVVVLGLCIGIGVIGVTSDDRKKLKKNILPELVKLKLKARKGKRIVRKLISNGKYLVV